MQMPIETLLDKIEKVRERLDEHGYPPLEYREYTLFVEIMDNVLVYITKGTLPSMPEETPKFQIQETTNEQDNRGVSQGQAAQVSG